MKVCGIVIFYLLRFSITVILKVLSAIFFSTLKMSTNCSQMESKNFNDYCIVDAYRSQALGNIALQEKIIFNSNLDKCLQSRQSTSAFFFHKV